MDLIFFNNPKLFFLVTWIGLSILRLHCMISLIRLAVVMKVAKSIKTVMTSRAASIVITLDMVMIQDAHLSIDANVVKESILRTPRIKLKSEVRI